MMHSENVMTCTAGILTEQDGKLLGDATGGISLQIMTALFEMIASWLYKWMSGMANHTRRTVAQVNLH